MPFGKWQFVEMSAMGKLKKNEDAFSVDVCSGIFISSNAVPMTCSGKGDSFCFLSLKVGNEDIFTYFVYM